MKAAVYHSYGPPDVVSIVDLKDAPGAPSPHQIRIRVRATTVSSADMRLRSLKMTPGFGLIARLAIGCFGPRKPILGVELSGQVEAIGEGVTRFAVGDQVFAFPGANLGAHAEYFLMPENGNVLPIPKNLTMEQAASLSFGGSTALHFLRDQAHIQPDQKVLVIGASGCVGTAVVQIAKALGAQVTGVCSEKNKDLVLSLGATDVIDYTSTTTTRLGQDGRKWHIVFDTIGTLSNREGLELLYPGGALIVISAGLGQLLAGLMCSRRSQGRRIFGGPAPEEKDVLASLSDLATNGSFIPVIDRIYPFNEIVKAHEYVDSGRKRGSVVVLL